MGSCCGTQEGPKNELNTTEKAKTAFSGDEPDEKMENKAAVAIQAHFKGLVARRAIKAQYGFEAHTKIAGAPTYTQSDAQIQEARKLVFEIRQKLAPFDYNPVPEDDGKQREAKGLMKLENGAEYEGEWDMNGQKDG